MIISRGGGGTADDMVMAGNCHAGGDMNIRRVIISREGWEHGVQLLGMTGRCDYRAHKLFVMPCIIAAMAGRNMER